MTVSEPVALEIVGALSGLIRTARTYSHLRHEQLGPTGIALAILKRLHDEPSRSGDIACALGVSASAVSRAVATVESLGYVVRQPDPADARASLLSLTAGGVQFLAEQHREHARRVAAVLDGWDDAKARDVLTGPDRARHRPQPHRLGHAHGRRTALNPLPSLEHRVRRQRRRRHHETNPNQNQKAYA